jgi:hypothetical protein
MNDAQMVMYTIQSKWKLNHAPRVCWCVCTLLIPLRAPAIQFQGRGWCIYTNGSNTTSFGGAENTGPVTSISFIIMYLLMGKYGKMMVTSLFYEPREEDIYKISHLQIILS